ncbi:MAG: hypothetical protein ACI9NC_002930, partial [Verrucomicrobiales bacterium]
MDEGKPTDSTSREDAPTHSARFSPYAPRRAEKPLKLPDVSDRDKLRQATAAIVQQDIPLTEAAEKYSVDP